MLLRRMPFHVLLGYFYISLFSNKKEKLLMQFVLQHVIAINMQ